MGVLVLAWTSMRFGTLVCYGIVLAWIANQERTNYLLGITVPSQRSVGVSGSLGWPYESSLTE